MITTVVAVLCRLVTVHSTVLPDRDCTVDEVKIEEIVTSSDIDDTVSFESCMMYGQIGVSDWKSHHPLYHTDRWRVARIKCVPGHYEIKGAV